MADKRNYGAEFSALKRDVAENKIGNVYVFDGEERYLLEHYLSEIRKKLVPEGVEEFNHRRFEGKGLDLTALYQAVDALPVFSERTLTEVWDFDFSKLNDEGREGMFSFLSELPDYSCLIFIYDTVIFKLDARVKINAQIKKLLPVVEFRAQEKSDIINWIGRRFKSLGKQIDPGTSEYLAFVSGGLMTPLIGEIEKTAAFCRGTEITRADIDAVVTPVLDAAVYKMTDAIATHRFEDAAAVLSDLIGMNEPAQKIIYSISMKMRQLFAARIYVEKGKSTADLMELCGIRYEFQAKNLLNAARRIDPDWCRRSVRLCADTALSLNSGGTAECLTVLLMRLAAGAKA